MTGAKTFSYSGARIASRGFIVAGVSVFSNTDITPKSFIINCSIKTFGKEYYARVITIVKQFEEKALPPFHALIAVMRDAGVNFLMHAAENHVLLGDL